MIQCQQFHKVAILQVKYYIEWLLDTNQNIIGYLNICCFLLLLFRFHSFKLINYHSYMHFTDLSI